jgi:hypothetical protein
MDQSLLTIPIISSMVFWLVGISINWRRVIATVVLIYAAVILAFQHFDSVADILNDIFGTSLWEDQTIAMGFGLSLVLALIVLYVLYTTLWKPAASTGEQPGGIRLIQSLLTALVGWSLGVLVIFCYIYYSADSFSFSQLNGSSMWNYFQITINLILKLVNPWMVKDPPQFFLLLAGR